MTTKDKDKTIDQKLRDFVDQWRLVSAGQEGQWYNDCASIDAMCDEIDDILKQTSKNCETMC